MSTSNNSDNINNNISDRRLAANRANARKSTGPRSPEGKAASSKNRTAHGLTSAQAVLPGEDPAPFNELLATLIEEHCPVNETESHQVELLAHCQWKLRRAARFEIEAIARDAGLSDDVMRAARYQASIRRSYCLALAELRRLQTERKKDERADLAALLDAWFVRMSQRANNETNPRPPQPPKDQQITTEDPPPPPATPAPEPPEPPIFQS